MRAGPNRRMYLQALYPPTPRRVGIKSQPTDIDSPDDRYIPGNPPPGETRGSLLSGATPVRFFSPPGGGGPLFSQPAHRPTNQPLPDPSSIHPGSIPDPSPIHL